MPKTIVNHVTFDNVAHTDAHATEEGIKQPENADGGSEIYDEAEELAKEE